MLDGEPTFPVFTKADIQMWALRLREEKDLNLPRFPSHNAGLCSFCFHVLFLPFKKSNTSLLLLIYFCIMPSSIIMLSSGYNYNHKDHWMVQLCD